MNYIYILKHDINTHTHTHYIYILSNIDIYRFQRYFLRLSSFFGGCYNYPHFWVAPSSVWHLQQVPRPLRRSRHRSPWRESPPRVVDLEMGAWYPVPWLPWPKASKISEDRWFLVVYCGLSWFKVH